MERTYTVKQAAEELEISRSRLYKLLSKHPEYLVIGEACSFTRGGYVTYLPQSTLDMIRNRKSISKLAESQA